VIAVYSIHSTLSRTDFPELYNKINHYNNNNRYLIFRHFGCVCNSFAQGVGGGSNPGIYIGELTQDVKGGGRKVEVQS
jgi:hypothetical protein